jgi:Arc/MetJ family transcription regulator
MRSRTTLEIDEQLLGEANNALAERYVAMNQQVPALTKTFIVDEALRALVRETAARRLAATYAPQSGVVVPARRRSK